MKTLQFEAIKVALKQDKTGYVLTLCVHPDDVPVELMRDYVGSHYQVVMVRLNQDQQPMNREEEFGGDRAVKLAGILAKEKEFWEFLEDTDGAFGVDEEHASSYIRSVCGIKSRSELKTNTEARRQFELLNKEYVEWKKS